MRRSSSYSSGWRVFYNSQPDPRIRNHLLFFSYYAVARSFTGWTIADIKAMTHRERMYWIDFIKWEKVRDDVNRPVVVNG